MLIDSLMGVTPRVARAPNGAATRRDRRCPGPTASHGQRPCGWTTVMIKRGRGPLALVTAHRRGNEERSGYQRVHQHHRARGPLPCTRARQAPSRSRLLCSARRGAVRLAEASAGRLRWRAGRSDSRLQGSSHDVHWLPDPCGMPEVCRGKLRGIHFPRRPEP